ncbi:CtsR family transcriptional regulator [Streptococcus pneumoniae]|nr:CtsR family transcriptional regulator [Streptococcus pneumoniae]
MRFKNTSDHIEAYIKAILDQSGIVELQRSQLADTFQVVPSQINYVIKTRFTESRGYLVESKRGGGGYIRIGRIEFSSHHEMLRELLYSIGERVSQEIYEDILQLLVEQELMKAGDEFASISSFGSRFRRRSSSCSSKHATSGHTRGR